jgi:NADPH-dependent curcumin reductase CurA
MPTLQDGQALVRVRLINIHSATRLRIARRSIAIGETDPNNYALGEVVLSRDPAFAVGAVVACQAGWQVPSNQ